MSTYDPKQMAQDALRVADPPPHSGLKSFVSEEGVIALATALEVALDEAESLRGLTEKISDLEETVDDQAATIEALKEKTKDFADKVALL